MKCLSAILLLLSNLLQCTPILGLKAPSQATATAMRVPRGGGGIPIKPEHMVKVFCSFYALNGALSLPAPEAAKDFDLKEGAADYVVFENLGAVSLSYATMVYLSAFSHRNAANIVALSALPCAYVSYKNTLKGLIAKMSGSKTQGPVGTALIAAGICCILKGKGNVEGIASALAIPPLLIGIVSQFDLGLGMKIAGFGTSVSGKKGQAIYVWYAALMAGWGALALMRLQTNLSALDAIARAAVLETLFMVDCMYIRKWNIGVAPDASNYVFLGIPLATAVVLLLR